MHANHTPDHPAIAAAAPHGPRCAFGRPHAWQSFAREGAVTADVFECSNCGAISDDREPAAERARALAAREREALADAAHAIEGFFSVPQRHNAIARAAVSAYLESMRKSEPASSVPVYGDGGEDA